MKKWIILCLIISLMLIGCTKDEEKETVKGFNSYCENFCIVSGMEQSEHTKIEEHTLNCVCQKVFLKKEWIENNKGG